jgi:hypothetical protein
MAEQPSPEWTHQEPGGEQDGGVQLLHNEILGGEEMRREIEREGGVGVKIVPFDEIADRTDEDRPEAPANVGAYEVLRCRCHHTGAPRQSRREARDKAQFPGPLVNNRVTPMFRFGARLSPHWGRWSILAERQVFTHEPVWLYAGEGRLIVEGDIWSRSATGGSPRANHRRSLTRRLCPSSDLGKGLARSWQ